MLWILEGAEVGRGARKTRGAHSARSYAAVLYGLASGGRSGVLKVGHDGQERSLRVLAGRPVSFESSVAADGLQASLEAAAAVPKRQLDWIVSKLEPGESLEDALVGSGALDEEQLAGHRRSILERGVGAALGWASGEWSFEPADAIDPTRVDPRLLPAFTLPAGLWRGVVEHVDAASVKGEVTAADAGDVGIRPALIDGLDGFGVESPLDELPGFIGVGSSAAALLDAVADPSGNVVKLLWLLEVVGLISRSGRATAADAALVHDLATRVAEPPAPPKNEAPSLAPIPPVAVESPADFATRSDPSIDAVTSRRRAAALRAAAADPKALAAAINADHAKRMGKTYYEFLGVEPDVSPSAIQSTSARLLRRWQSASRSNHLPSEVRALADELAKGITLVTRILGDTGRRAEYDRRLARGQAPVLEGIRGASASAIRATTNPRARRTDPRRRQHTDPGMQAVTPDSSDEHAQGRALLAKRDWDGAVPLLQRARRKAPSDATVLAELGWAVYNAKGKAHNPDEADEFLRLALTFDPKQTQALEYLARIAVRGSDVDDAHRRLRKLLAVDPKHRWARRTMNDLPEPGTADKSGKRSFGFWKKE